MQTIGPTANKQRRSSRIACAIPSKQENTHPHGTFAQTGRTHCEFGVNEKTEPPIVMPRRRSTERTFEAVFDTHATRLLLCLTAVLSVALVVAHIPGAPNAEYTSWGDDAWGDDRWRAPVTASEFIERYPETQLVFVAEEDAASSPSDAALISDVRADPQGKGASASGGSATSKRSTVRSVAALGPDSSKPRILGGMKKLYLDIEYPEDARRRGIQGRVILDFIVHESGRVSNISVLQSLSPSCDSAVVRALNGTTFVPAQVNDEPVSVRMALPVRFLLIDETEEKNAPTPPVHRDATQISDARRGSS